MNVVDMTGMTNVASIHIGIAIMNGSSDSKAAVPIVARDKIATASTFVTTALKKPVTTFHADLRIRPMNLKNFIETPLKMFKFVAPIDTDKEEYYY